MKNRLWGLLALTFLLPYPARAARPNVQIDPRWITCQSDQECAVGRMECGPVCVNEEFKDIVEGYFKGLAPRIDCWGDRSRTTEELMAAALPRCVQGSCRCYDKKDPSRQIGTTLKSGTADATSTSGPFKEVQALLAQNNLCAAAEKFHELAPAHSGDTGFRPMWETLMERIGKLTGEEYMKCISPYTSMEKMMPGDGPSPLLLIERGKSYLDKKDFATAKKYLDRVKRSYPNDKFLPWALLYGAECDAALGNTEIAIKSLQQLVSTYPDHSLAKEAKVRLQQLEKGK